MNPCNSVVIDGELLENAVLRYTPAGIAVVDIKLKHQSQQSSAGQERQVELEMTCRAIGEDAMALRHLQAGCRLKVKGYLVARSQRYPGSLVLQINQYALQT